MAVASGGQQVLQKEEMTSSWVGGTGSARGSARGSLGAVLKEEAKGFAVPVWSQQETVLSPGAVLKEEVKGFAVQVWWEQETQLTQTK
mgnify:CR=1 FL=1